MSWRWEQKQNHPHVALSSEPGGQKLREDTGISSFSSVGPREQKGWGGSPGCYGILPQEPHDPHACASSHHARPRALPAVPTLLSALIWAAMLVPGPKTAWRLHRNTYILGAAFLDTLCLKWGWLSLRAFPKGINCFCILCLCYDQQASQLWTDKGVIGKTTRGRYGSETPLPSPRLSGTQNVVGQDSQDNLLFAWNSN